MTGSAYPDVLLIKECLNERELSGEPLLGGRDGDALRAALDKLGFADDAWAACSVPRIDGDHADADLLAFAVEVFDPELVIALDPEAADALSRAWETPISEGAGVLRVRGRRVLALGGFEKALDDDSAKQRMWAMLKTTRPLAAPL